MLKMSCLNKTWLIDIDGTIVRHNGYQKDGFDTILDGVINFFQKINPQDKVIFLTSRKEKDLEGFKKLLYDNNIKYDLIISQLPYGERILVNDKKPSGLKCAIAVNKKRDEKFSLEYETDETL